MKCRAGGGCSWGERAWHGAVQDYSAGRAQVRCGQITQMQGYSGGFGQELQMVCDRHIPGASLVLNKPGWHQLWAGSAALCPSQGSGSALSPVLLFSTPQCLSQLPPSLSVSCRHSLAVLGLCPGSCVPLGPSNPEPSSGSGQRAESGKRQGMTLPRVCGTQRAQRQPGLCPPSQPCHASPGCQAHRMRAGCCRNKNPLPAPGAVPSPEIKQGGKGRRDYC